MKFIVGILVVALSASGCVDSGCSLHDSTMQSTHASNSGSDLSFSMNGGTGAEQYVWDFDASKAEVTWTGDISAGSVAIAMFDGCGNQVYNASIAAGSSSITKLSNGDAEPGKWLLMVAMSQVQGTVSFEVSPA